MIIAVFRRWPLENANILDSIWDNEAKAEERIDLLCESSDCSEDDFFTQELNMNEEVPDWLVW